MSSSNPPPPRRFDPTPIEQITKTSRMNSQASGAEHKKPRLAPPEGADTNAAEAPKNTLLWDGTGRKSSRGPRLFRPEPIATAKGSNRRRKQEAEAAAEAEAPPAEKMEPRRFAPELVDTAQRSRRAGDKKIAMVQSDKTELGHILHAIEHRKHIVGEGEGGAQDTDGDVVMGDGHSAVHPELRRQISPVDGSPGPRSPVLTKAHHSYHTPGLDTIQSSESEQNSDPSSVADSPGVGGSPITASDHSNEQYKHATRVRESIDESFTHYLMELERKMAQQRLENQALAAYPNADFVYEPVDHYVDQELDSDEMDIEERPVTWEGHEDDLFEMARRESTVKVTWEQLEAQRHGSQLERDRQANKVTATKQPSVAKPSPWWKPDGLPGAPPDRPARQLPPVQNRARPPMLGGSLVFPRSNSPEPARFDVTQGPAALRNQISSYRAATIEESAQRPEQEGGLWRPATAAELAPTLANDDTITGTDEHKGLWAGFCFDDGTAAKSTNLAPPPSASGLKTPSVESGNPFDALPAAQPPKPVVSDPSVVRLQPPQQRPQDPHDTPPQTIDTILTSDRDLDTLMEMQFPDAFVTQVFNYLSLGYPTLARPFDEELAKISRVPLEDLRKDDEMARGLSKGYIRIGEDFQGEGLDPETSVRWEALRRYVREWARQERKGEWGEGVGADWGTGARRGSWAG